MKALIDSALTKEVLSRLNKTPDPRFKKVMTSLIRHLHSFARDVKLTEPEWFAAIMFLTQVGQKCDDLRQEFILLSDIMGLSMTVVELNHGKPKGASEATVQGPFYIEGAPELAHGATVEGMPKGDMLEITGKVSSLKGKKPLANALLDVWQAGDDGLYSNQDTSKPKYELRGKFRTDKDGVFSFKTVMPRGYQIPTDGPVGKLMELMGRPPWRPAHIHFMVSAPGHQKLTTHLFVKGAPHIKQDAVFGVKNSLIVDFKKKKDGGYGLKHDFTLNPA